MYKKYFLLILSALTYAMPFVFSDQLWWLVMLFPLLFLYVALTEKLSFKEGFVWGAVAWPGLLHGALWGAFTMGSGPWLYRLVPMIFIFFYESITAGVWLWLSQKILTRFRITNLFQRTCFWVTSLALYLIWATEYQMIIFDRAEGYLLSQPLLLFSYYPPLLALLPQLGIMLMTFLFCATAGATVYLFLARTRNAFLLWFIFMAPWLLGMFIPVKKTTPPKWLGKVERLTKTYYDTKNLKLVVWAITHEINKIVDKNPNVEMIVLPESAVYADKLPDHPELFNYWSTEYVGKPLHVLVGGYRWTDGKYRNSLYWIYDGKVQGYFDKRHAMTLTERMPSMFNFDFITKAYYNEFPTVTASDNERVAFKLLDTELIPYLCSETFFNRCPDDNTSSTILSSCNDTWTSCEYIKKLMYVGARFKAIQWQRDILYTTFLHGAYFDKLGGVWQLNA